MMELVYMQDLKFCAIKRVSSSLTVGTKLTN